MPNEKQLFAHRESQFSGPMKQADGKHPSHRNTDILTPPKSQFIVKFNRYANLYGKKKTQSLS
jgi:hypothetical protein